MEDAIQLVLIGLGQGSLYALIALGFVLIYKCSGILNIAQGELVLVGAYLGYAFTAMLGYPWWLSIILVLISVGFVAVVFERLALRPMIGQPIMAQMLMTLGVASFLQGALVTFFGGNILKAPPIFPRGGLEAGTMTLSFENGFAIVLALSLLLLFSLFFKYVPVGLRMRAVADNPIAAQSIGIKLARVYQSSWALAAMVAALGGTILGSIGGIWLGMSELGLKSIVVVLLGGLESVVGVIIAGPLLGVIEAFAIQYVDPLLGGGIRDVVSFAILIPILLILPHGLFGWKIIERV